MKIETRDITVTTVVAIAFDGTEFQTPAECEIYELLHQYIIGPVTKDPLGAGWTYYPVNLYTRNSVYWTNHILRNATITSDDSAQGNDTEHLTILAVQIQENKVIRARLIRPEKLVWELSNGLFAVVPAKKQPAEEQIREG